MKTKVIPVVIVGALGTVKKGMIENIKKVSERAKIIIIIIIITIIIIIIIINWLFKYRDSFYYVF